MRVERGWYASICAPMAPINDVTIRRRLNVDAPRRLRATLFAVDCSRRRAAMPRATLTRRQRIQTMRRAALSCCRDAAALVLRAPFFYVMR